MLPLFPGGEYPTLRRRQVCLFGSLSWNGKAVSSVLILRASIPEPHPPDRFRSHAVMGFRPSVKTGRHLRFDRKAPPQVLIRSFSSFSRIKTGLGCGWNYLLHPLFVYRGSYPLVSRPMMCSRQMYLANRLAALRLSADFR